MADMDVLIPRHSGPIPVAIDPVALVVTECITVTSAMRKHARWAHSSISSILGSSAPSPRLTPTDARRTDRSSSTIDVSDDTESALTSRWGLRGRKGHERLCEAQGGFEELQGYTPVRYTEPVTAILASHSQ